MNVTQTYVIPTKTVERQTAPLSNTQTLLMEAEKYLSVLEQEQGTTITMERCAAIRADLEQYGTYWHTREELVYGAQLSWRNSNRCVGRLHWQSLHVQDCRHILTAEGVFQALLEHINYATNGGKIRSTMTVFAPQIPRQPGIRIWNSQLIRYAGYRQPDGSIIGDPMQADFTEMVRRLGWRGAKGTPFDVLPLVIQMPHQAPRLFELPQQAILEVPLEHPDFPWFAELGLKWHALPAVSNMRMEIGGVSYTAAPFNGWYMGAEIGARNLGDSSRYNMLPVVAEHMGLKTKSDRTLWKDLALVELNRAVLSSFAKHGIVIVDHHTVSKQFLLHEQREQSCGRETTADWAWLVPPISGSQCPMFHRNYHNDVHKPNFFYQDDPWSR